MAGILFRNSSISLWSINFYDADVKEWKKQFKLSIIQNSFDEIQCVSQLNHLCQLDWVFRGIEIAWGIKMNLNWIGSRSFEWFGFPGISHESGRAWEGWRRGREDGVSEGDFCTLVRLSHVEITDIFLCSVRFSFKVSLLQQAKYDFLIMW